MVDFEPTGSAGRLAGRGARDSSLRTSRQPCDPNWPSTARNADGKSRAFRRRIGERGWFGLNWPSEYRVWDSAPSISTY